MNTRPLIEMESIQSNLLIEQFHYQFTVAARYGINSSVISHGTAGSKKVELWKNAMKVEDQEN